ncbi:MAG: hypothetical protein GY923_15975, partial [Aestuariibacter sp.]|nr:hypothetical protein [Aestuariibacter sp.]
TLSATASTSEDGGTITYTAKLPDGVITNNAITVTLNVGANGETASNTNPALTITIAAGQSSGTVDATVARDNDDGSGEDKFIETDSLSAAISGVSEANAGTAGSLENLTFDDTAQTTTITNDNDEVEVTLSATASTSEDGGTITYTAKLPDGVITNNAITVTLNVGANGETASNT